MPISPFRAAYSPATLPPSSSARSARSDAPALTTQFEQLLVRQLLTQVRATRFGETDQSSSAASYQAIADDHLAQLIASVGGLGIGAALSKTMGSPTSGSAGALANEALTKQATKAVLMGTDPLFEK